MTAPLPLRYYNPVKEMCGKYNLDYETVIGTGLKQTRDAFLCAEIQKPITEIKAEDRKLVKHKKEFFDRKYGSATETNTTGGETEDKGALRYSEPLSVSIVRDDDREMDKSSNVSSNVGTNTLVKGTIAGSRKPWVPGRPQE